MEDLKKNYYEDLEEYYQRTKVHINIESIIGKREDCQHAVVNDSKYYPLKNDEYESYAETEYYYYEINFRTCVECSKLIELNIRKVWKKGYKVT